MQLCKGLTKNSCIYIKVGGWGQQWADFPLILFFKKNISLNSLELPIQAGAELSQAQTSFLAKN